jgi:signal transduction histidine kinase
VTALAPDIFDGPVGLSEILITARLQDSTLCAPNLQAEGKALRVLARVLATEPHKLIDTLLETALELCGAGTGGLSVLETLPSGEQVFRWTNLAGRLKQFTGGATPRHFSPCGVCLDNNSPQLFFYPARRFQYLGENVDVPIVEALVIPVPPGFGAPATIWILTHGEPKEFNAEDVRIMTDLADFTGCALGLLRSLTAEQDSRKRAEAEVSQRRTAEADLISIQRDLEKAIEAQYDARRQGEVEITRRKQSEADLQRSNDALERLVEARASQLRQLSAKLQILQDTEHRRIARELHDGAGQYLAGIQMNLDACLRDKSGNGNSRIAEARGMADQCLSEIRTISYLLHPPLLDEVGLVSALSWYTEGFSERSGISVELKVPRDLGRLPSEAETAIFRVVQQALANIHRHSGSKTARVVMAAEAEQVRLEICDEGRGIPAEILGGFSTGTRLPGVGLAGMRERISNMGGKFNILSSPKGTTIQATLPVTPSPASQATRAN